MPKLDDLPDLLTIKETAQVLRCSEVYARKLCKTGAIKARKVGRCWRVPQDALADYFNQRNDAEVMP